LQGDPGEVARELGGSIIQGAGQFCTKPGVIVLHEGSDAQKFVASLSHAMTAQPIHRLLAPEIVRGFEAATRAIAARPDVRIVLPGSVTADIPTPLLAVTDAKTFVTDALLRDEVFGPACIVVSVRSTAEVIDVLEAVGGSLTVTVRGASDDNEQTRSIVRASIRIAGRVLFAGVPTGVAVSDAQHHGGPWPSSTQPSMTSVGYSALDRFLRPVALQAAPAWLLERSGRPL
jgi:NADP-dependent aldehyde dehydrogenase